MANTAFELTEPIRRAQGWTGEPVSERFERSVELGPVPDPVAMEAEWRTLQAHSDHSFFQSWGWISTWLRLLPAEIRPSLLRIRRGVDTVGLGFVVERTVWRRGLIRSRTAFLHETGRSELDKVAIEHNGLLLRREDAPTTERIALEFLSREIARGRWDEVMLPGVGPRSEQAAAFVCEEWPSLLALRRAPSHIVDLDHLRRKGGAIPEIFRQSLRKDVRRSMRRADQYGGLRVEEACSLDQGLEFLAGLIELHEARWAAAGEPGAFSSPWLRRFHNELVRRRFRAGEIQLLRISIGKTPIGYLYNFIYGDRLYAYQWGLARQPDRQVKVGLLCDALALAHNLDRPIRSFDFLHGDSEYKRRFATHAEERFWLVLQRPRVDFRVENALRTFRRNSRWRGWLG